MNVYKIRKMENKLTKGLLDLVVLGFLKSEPMHGYKIIQNIRHNFGIYFGPSTIYPFLKEFEKSGYIKSEWDVNSDRPRKVYHITSKGQGFLTGCEESFKFICTKLNRMGMNRIPVSTNIQKVNSINEISNSKISL
jgi:PadR family transcriptional regulator PadR